MRGPARPRAALWLVPALASAASLPPAYVPSALVALPLLEAEGSFEVPELAFRVNVLESQEPCGHSNITLNGQPLPEDGHGSLPYDPWTSLIATWSSTCVEWSNGPREQLLNLVIDSVNGSIVRDVRLRLLFQQVAPAWIADIEHFPDAGKHHGLHDIVDVVDKPESEGLDAELADLERLRQHAAELDRLISSKEEHLRVAYAWDGQRSPKQRPFSEPISHLHAAVTEHPMVAPDDDSMSPEHPVAPDEPVPPEASIAPEPPRQPVHLTRLGVAAIASPRSWPVLLVVKILAILAFFSFFLHLFVRCNRSCAAHRERRRQRRVAREARRARREARRAAFKAAVKGFFRRVLPGLVPDEEKAAMIRQPESDTESDLGNTMEQEIAQFRAAANVVGDMINAAEEGRTQQRRRQEFQNPPEDYTPTPPSPGAFAEYMPDDDIPPAYEERRRSASITAETSVVAIADGFRYTPGSSNYTPSSGASQTGDADDEPPKY